MKKLLLGLMVALTTLTMVLPEAEARRMGGSRSFGKQSQNLNRPAPAQPAQNSAAKPATPGNAQATPPKPASPWKNILGGALLGLGLGALLSHLGLSGALASMISTLLMVALIAFAVMFIVRLVRRKNGPQAAYAGAANPSAYNKTAYVPEIGSRIDQPAAPAAGAAVAAAPVGSWGVPEDFDTAGFLRHAKTYFIRLQAAWDRADINDIREFTTPEMFAELKMQIQERGASPNTTDVVSIEAELIGIETLADEYLASVRFHGMISEEAGAPAAPFAEVWNLSKPVSGDGGWALAGIQQLS